MYHVAAPTPDGGLSTISLCGTTASGDGAYKSGRRLPWGVTFPPGSRRACLTCDALERADADHAAIAAAFERARRQDAESATLRALAVASARPARGWRGEIIRVVALQELTRRRALVQP